MFSSATNPFPRAFFLLTLSAFSMTSARAVTPASEAEGGRDRFLQIFKPQASASPAQWASISQYDPDGTSLPTISLSSDTFLEISAVKLSGHRILITGSFRGNFYYQDQFQAFYDRTVPFFLYIDAYGVSNEPVILDNTSGRLAVSCTASGRFILLAYRYLTPTTLEIARWGMGEGQQDGGDITEEERRSLEEAQLENNAPVTQSFVELPIDNTEDPEG